MSWENNETREKVTRCTLAMSNIRDGGTLIFGVDEVNSGEYNENGMDPGDSETFNQDDVSDYVNEFSDPPIQLKIDKVTHTSKIFLVIQINEFEEIPIVCKKSGQDLKRGAIYTRSKKKNESVQVSSQNEMREILEMALEKNLRKFMIRLERSGLIKLITPKVEDETRFENQLGDL
ncbi:hypothetical protein ES703_122691 [subsurface metagenome]